jgi:hypothetical protein
MNIRLRLWFSPSTSAIVLLAIGWLVERCHNQLAPVSFRDVAGITFIAFLAWISSVLCRADFYASKIDKDLEFYQNCLAITGISLHPAPGGCDDAPCDSEYLFLAQTVRIRLGPIRSWRMIRTIYEMKVSRAELERYSKWDHARVPTI